ncbi:hypothetical protein T11_241, partial [Trichinella zimbabwensis]
LIIFCSLSKLLASSRFWLVLDGAATDGGSVAIFALVPEQKVMFAFTSNNST